MKASLCGRQSVPCVKSLYATTAVIKMTLLTVLNVWRMKMMFELKGDSVDALYAEACWKFKDTETGIETTRNGVVLTQQAPSMITLESPRMRVLFNARRDANPFFHLMETIWMWAGRRDVGWIQQFNKGIARYAETNGVFHGAYGYRWRGYNGFDQLTALADQISKDPSSRQHVLSMWAGNDLTAIAKDKPCNLDIVFRVITGPADQKRLDMTVFNRSNDLIWGALGANIVHMTMLHELMALSTGCELGVYRVVSTNLHVYYQHWDLLSYAAEADSYKGIPCSPLHDGPTPAATPAIDIALWLKDAKDFCHDNDGPFYYPWFGEVALPMKRAYLDKDNRKSHINNVGDIAWQQAASMWTARRLSK